MRYFYAGYADPPFGSWKLFEDTDEARAQALKEGFTAFGTMSFSSPPEEGSPPPTRYGDLIIDLDNKEDPAIAIEDAQRLIRRLEEMGANPEAFRFWVSGGKGCHISIPAEIFGGEEGDTDLPRIHQKMLESICNRGKNPPHDRATRQIVNCMIPFDKSMYCMGKGKLLRIENIKRSNGRYKIPVSFQEFNYYSAEDLLKLAESPRFIGKDCPLPHPAVRVPALVKLYEECQRDVHAHNSECSGNKGLKAIEECVFIQHCRENSKTLSEPEWFAMISILAPLGSPGVKLIHELSKDYPGYSYDETTFKINNAQRFQKPCTCQYIKTLFPCGCDCGVKSPTGLCRQVFQPQSQKFFCEDNGVYYQRDPENPDKRCYVCSYLRIIAQVRDCEGGSWGKLAECRDPDGLMHEEVLLNTEVSGMGDQALEKLIHVGLDVQPSRNSRELVRTYIASQHPELRVILVEKAGWKGDIYVKGDKGYGEKEGREYRQLGEITNEDFRHQGTLEEWKSNVAALCVGNPLLEFAMSTAFVGPLLEPCQHDGFGMHYHGPSSCGKTTALRVAGSVCGNTGNHGFIKQWRTTDNALESLAVRHNDNLLCLDEMGQASSKTVSDSAYMLANGQGKLRATKSGGPRKRQVWRLVFLSNGEVTLDDKIAEEGGLKAKAGQTVRVVNIDADGGADMGVFTKIPASETPRSFSTLLNKNSLLYYGTALDEFLEQLTANKTEYASIVNESKKTFVEEVCPKEASAQVERVCAHFGLIAAAGEMAISMGILPWPKGQSYLAATHCFKSWLSNRGSIGDIEIDQCIERLIRLCSVYKDSRFKDLDGSCYTPYDLAGYIWSKNGKKFILILPNVFSKEIRKNYSERGLMNELERKGYVAMNKNGNRMETFSRGGRNIRGYIFDLEALEGESFASTSSRLSTSITF